MASDRSGLSVSMAEYIMRNWRDMTELTDVEEPFLLSDVPEVPWGAMQKLSNKGYITAVGRDDENKTARLWEIDTRVVETIQKYERNDAGDCENSVLPCKCSPGVNNVKSDDGVEDYECPICGIRFLECEVKDDADTDGLWRDEDVLQVLYVDRGMTTREVGEVLGVHKNTVNRWIRRADSIELRSSSSEPDYPELTDEQWLREKYVEQQLSTYEVAELLGCSDTQVSHWLAKHGIETRDDIIAMQRRRASA